MNIARIIILVEVTLLLLVGVLSSTPSHDLIFVMGDETMSDHKSIVYTVPEEVPVDPVGKHPLGQTYKISHRNAKVIDAGKYTKHLNVLSTSSVRIFSTYSTIRAFEQITAGSGNILSVFSTHTSIEVIVVTNNHVVPAVLRENGIDYMLMGIEIDNSVGAIYDSSIPRPQCSRLHTNQDLLNFLNNSLTADLAFLNCSIVDPEEIAMFDRTVSVVPQTFTKPHGSLFGTGYPGQFPSPFDRLFFYSQLRIATSGEYTIGENLTVIHTAPTKKGMSGSALATLHLPKFTFSCIHYGGTGTNNLNGCVSVANPGFACLYGRLVAPAAFAHTNKQKLIVKYLASVENVLDIHCPTVKTTTSQLIQDYEKEKAGLEADVEEYIATGEKDEL